MRGTSCQTVVSLLFRHFHKRLNGRVQVTGVRINGNEAYAFVGSTTKPASFIIVKREGGDWKIGTLLGGPLP